MPRLIITGNVQLYGCVSNVLIDSNCQSADTQQGLRHEHLRWPSCTEHNNFLCVSII